MHTKNHYDLNNHDVLSLDATDVLNGIAIDCVIIGFHEKTLKILLNRFSANTKWMLPGGVALKDEGLDEAADRILKARTGLENIYLRQFYMFGECNRTQDEDIAASLQSNNILKSKVENHWIRQRILSASYYALINYSKATTINTPQDETRWFDIKEIPVAIFGDHKRIIENGLSAIREHLNLIPIDYALLPEVFSMSELRSVYETVLGTKLDRRNFQKKMLQADYIIKLKRTKGKNLYKPTILYSFDRDKYTQALKDSIIYHVLPQLG